MQTNLNCAHAYEDNNSIEIYLVYEITHVLRVRYNNSRIIGNVHYYGKSC